MMTTTRTSRQGRAGFTLIELMLAVGVLGLLSALGITEFSNYADKAKRTEAYYGLATIRAVQDAFFIDKNRFGKSFDEIDFEVRGGKRVSSSKYRGKRYVYDLAQPWGVQSWYCSATANLDGDPWPDVLVTWDKQE